MTRVSVDEAKKNLEAIAERVFTENEPLVVVLANGREIQLVPVRESGASTSLEKELIEDAERFMDDYNEDFQRLAR